MIKDKTLARYTGSIPSILLYQAVTKIILMISCLLSKEIITLLLNKLETPAITNMDLPLLLRSWEGIVILIVLLLLLVWYTLVDINGTILLADSVLHQKNRKIFSILKEAIVSVRYMMHPYALILVIYIALLAPITMAFYGISLTSQFYIPDFIFSVIKQNAQFYVPYYVVVVLICALAFVHVYCFHYMVLNNETIKESLVSSRQTMKEHWKDFLRRYGWFLIKSIGVAILISVLLIAIPFVFCLNYVNDTEIKRFVLVFFYFHISLLVMLFRALFTPFQMMELNRLYESYSKKDTSEYVYPKHSLHVPFWILTIMVYGVIVVFSVAGTMCFDLVFHPTTEHNIIAHRAGGNLGNENTLVALEAAIQEKVYAAEIDVQRTKDGKYIVFHDDDLNRLCDVDAKPGDLTLKELKKLEVKDTFHIGGESTELATPEEMLAGCKDKIHLYLELKGVSADDKMAEDMYQLIKQYDMLDQVTIICLHYDILKTLKEKHPDITTGYLCYLAIGNISKLNVDELLLEDELASASTIEKAHDAGKKVYIWTVNSEQTLGQRLMDSSDGVITDYVRLAEDINEVLAHDDDCTAMFRALFSQIQH